MNWNFLRCSIGIYAATINNMKDKVPHDQHELKTSYTILYKIKKLIARQKKENERSFYK